LPKAGKLGSRLSADLISNSDSRDYCNTKLADQGSSKALFKLVLEIRDPNTKIYVGKSFGRRFDVFGCESSSWQSQPMTRDFLLVNLKKLYGYFCHSNLR
jgi:hypothetical protein